MPPFSYARAALVINSTNVTSGTPGEFLFVNTNGTVGQKFPEQISCAKGVIGTFAATGNTLTIDADQITVVDSNGEANVIVSPGAALVCDIDTAGPIINGRDQVAAFTVSTDVHFYWIWNGTTLASIASSVPPPVGPTLPTGYTFFAYIGTVALNGAGTIPNAQIRGNYITYNVRENIRNMATGGGVETAVDLRNSSGRKVPVIAQNLSFSVEYWGLTSNGAGSVVAALTIRDISGSTLYDFNINVTVAAGSFYQPGPPNYFEAPNPANSTIYFSYTVSAGTIGNASLNVIGWTVPNNAS